MKNIIITGTSRGIGLEVAKQFAKMGHRVLAISRKTNENLKTLENIALLSVDISNEKDLEKVNTYIKNNWEKVDILIHNAGSLLHKPFEETTRNDFEFIYSVNVFALASLTQVVLPYFKKGSHVVTISSMGGIQGSMKFAGLAAYSSSKGAVITLSELLAEEYKDKGISFNVLAIGAVQTEMLEEAFPGYIAPLSAQQMAHYIVDFSLNGNLYYNGKVLQVSSSTP